MPIGQSVPASEQVRRLRACTCPCRVHREAIMGSRNPFLVRRAGIASKATLIVPGVMG